MRILITGAAGNLGTFLARYLADGPHQLRLMVHQRAVAADLLAHGNVEVVRADLALPATLVAACAGVDCIVHFAGVLFAPRPEKFLPVTNVAWVQNLIRAARAAGVRRFVLVSFPHVEGETSPQQPATDRLDRVPPSVHARTRLAAERLVLAEPWEAVVLRAGTVYGNGVLMVEAARWLARRHLLAVWPEPTWFHFIALPDFLSATAVATELPTARGIYNIGDDQPLTLQEFLDAACAEWGYRRPWRLPRVLFPIAGAAVELGAAVFGTRAPLTRDFIRIGMVSHVMDTARMKRELLPGLQYPTLREGRSLLRR